MISNMRISQDFYCSSHQKKTVQSPISQTTNNCFFKGPSSIFIFSIRLFPPSNLSNPPFGLAKVRVRIQGNSTVIKLHLARPWLILQKLEIYHRPLTTLQMENRVQIKVCSLVVSTHLKNMSQNGFIFPKDRVENKKYLSCHHPNLDWD